MCGYQSDPANVFELYTTRGFLMRNWFDSLNRILRKVDVNFVMKEDGIKVSHADENRNALVVSKLVAKEFEFYRCDTRIAAGFDTEKLYKIARSVLMDTSFSMYIQRDNTDTLFIKTCDAFGRNIYRHKLELIDDVPSEEVKIPEFAYPRSISLPPHLIQNTLRDMELHGAEVKIQTIKDRLILRKYNSYPIHIMFTLESIDGEIVDMTAEVHRGVFDLKNIRDFMKGYYGDVRFFVRNDQPLLIEFEFSTLGNLRIFIEEVHEGIPREAD